MLFKGNWSGSIPAESLHLESFAHWLVNRYMLLQARKTVGHSSCAIFRFLSIYFLLKWLHEISTCQIKLYSELKQTKLDYFPTSKYRRVHHTNSTQAELLLLWERGLKVGTFPKPEFAVPDLFCVIFTVVHIFATFFFFSFLIFLFYVLFQVSRFCVIKRRSELWELT